MVSKDYLTDLSQKVSCFIRLCVDQVKVLLDFDSDGYYEIHSPLVTQYILHNYMHSHFP